MSKTNVSSLAILLSNEKLSYITKRTSGDDTLFSDVYDYSVDFTNLKKTEIEIEHELRSNHILLQEYDFVHFCFLSTNINVVPHEYIIYPLENMLSMSTSGAIKLAIDCPLQNIDASIIYDVYYPLKDTLLALKNLENARLYHSGKFLIDFAKLNTKSIGVYLNLIHNRLEICIIKSGELAFYNIFEIKTDEDCLFFILYTLSQLSINLDTTPVFIFGEHINYIDKLRRYIKNIRLDSQDKKLGKYFTLYKLFECELYQEH